MVVVVCRHDLAISPYYPRNGSDWTHQMPLSVQRRTIMIVATGHVVAIVLDDWMLMLERLDVDGRTLPPERYDSRQAKQQKYHIVCPSLFFDGYEWCAVCLVGFITIHSQ